MKALKQFPLVVLTMFVLAPGALAKSPEKIRTGGQLFTKSWIPSNPTLGGDGLGPLFNATSCVACHHQGGVGGAGDSRFNVNAIGIEHLQISGVPITDDLIQSTIRSFHPGFVNRQGQVQNTMSIHHHGGTPQFLQSKSALKSKLDTVFAPQGGSTTASEVRRGSHTPIVFEDTTGNRKLTLRARLFQRNTTPLFGLGLLDQIDGKDIEEQVRVQKQHPEISGRPGTLENGLYGKFGWRANRHSLLKFVEQACAIEVGLESRRMDQASDPMLPTYRNTAYDIKDQQIIAMRDFIAALPAPTRELPTDSHQRTSALRGEQLFSTVGCAVCHVPNMGPAKGIYSDVLLHDMGYELMDLNAAPAYITRITPVSKSFVESTTQQTSTSSSGYGGQSATISTSTTSSSSGSPSSGSSRRRRGSRLSFEFRPPTGPLEKMKIITLDEERSDASVSHSSTARGRSRTQSQVVHQKNLRLHFEHTNINQEWRTPPLWGVRDSAPYMHDGRAETLLEAIAMHDGEAAGTRDRFLLLPLADRRAIVEFLNTLVAPKGLAQFDPDQVH